MNQKLQIYPWIVGLLLGLAFSGCRDNNSDSSVTESEKSESRESLGDSLIVAAKKGSKQKVTHLIQQGADLNTRDKLGRTAMHWAARNGHSDVIILLLEAGAEASIRDFKGKTPLALAKASKNGDVAERLLSRVVRNQALRKIDSLGLKRSDTDQIFHNACQSGDIERVCLMLDVGVSPNTKLDDTSSNRPLHISIINRHTDVALLLIQSGAEVDGLNAQEQTPLHLAARDGCDQEVAFLLKERANVSAEDENGDTPLHYAAESGDENAVTLILEAGALIDAKDSKQATPLHKASLAGQEGVMKLLLKRGASRKAALTEGWSELHFAASIGETDQVRELLARSPDVNVRDDYGRTALQAATPAAMRTLLAVGADVNARDEQGNTALHLAARRGNAEEAQILVNAGANLEARNHAGWAPLHMAAAVEGHADIVRILLAAGADANAPSETLPSLSPPLKLTPLHMAAMGGNLDIIRILLAAGANPNAKDSGGNTPMDLALEADQPEAAELLRTYKSSKDEF